MDRRVARAVLGVAAGSSRQDVVRAYRRAAARNHPDVGGDEVAFRRVVAARDALLDDDAAPVVSGRPARGWLERLVATATRLEHRRRFGRRRRDLR